MCVRLVLWSDSQKGFTTDLNSPSPDRVISGTSVPTLTGSRQLATELREQVQILCGHLQIYSVAIGKILEHAQKTETNLVDRGANWDNDAKYAFIGFLGTVSGECSDSHLIQNSFLLVLVQDELWRAVEALLLG